MVVKTSAGKHLVSVIITVYNRRDKVRRALRSVFKQTFKDIEIILIDDGSTDNLENDIAELVNSDSKLIYIKHSNKGTVLSLNTGIKLSSGKYITFLDSDDLYETTHIEKRIKYSETHKDVDIIHSSARIIGDEKNMFVPDARNTNKLIHLSKCIIGGTIFGKRSAFVSLGGFREIYAYDYDFIQRAKTKFKVVKLNLPTYIYMRDSADSVLTNYKKLNFREK